MLVEIPSYIQKIEKHIYKNFKQERSPIVVCINQSDRPFLFQLYLQASKKRKFLPVCIAMQTVVKKDINEQENLKAIFSFYADGVYRQAPATLIFEAADHIHWDLYQPDFVVIMDKNINEKQLIQLLTSYSECELIITEKVTFNSTKLQNKTTFYN